MMEECKAQAARRFTSNRTGSAAVDLLVVGAGPTGCVVAEQAARRGLRVVVIDRRTHLAGNSHDSLHSCGVLIHNYGPHYFRTNSVSLFRYLSRFTDWIDGRYIVRSYVAGSLYPFPINLTTLENFFGCKLAPDEARRLLAAERAPIHEPSNSEELVMSRIGARLYRAFYQGYTRKQWGRPPSELDASICARIPVRLNRDERYVEHTYQRMPKDGYTRLFANMLTSPYIEVRLGVPYSAVRDAIRPSLATVYCGPLDEYFDYRFGRLEWRSLHFDFREVKTSFAQPCVQINYPNDFNYTRTVEVKHITGQPHASTVVCYEYPTATGEPFYPVHLGQYGLLDTYRKLAAAEYRNRKVVFAGRLGRYQYLDMDEAMLAAIDLARNLLKGR